MRLLCHHHHHLHRYYDDYNYYQWCNCFGSSWEFLFFFDGTSSPSCHDDHLLYFPNLFETQREVVVEELHHLYKPFFLKSQPLSPRTIPIFFLSDKIIYWAIFPSHSHIWWTSLILKTSDMTSWMVYLSITILYYSHQLCKLYGPRANVKVQLGIKHNSPLILIILFSNSYLKNIKSILVILLINLSKNIYINL